MAGIPMPRKEESPMQSSLSRTSPPPAPENAVGGGVRVSTGRLEIREWQTTEPDIVRYFEEHSGDGDLASVFERVLKVGALALATAGTSVDVNYVEKEFTRLQHLLEQALEERVRHVTR